LQLFAQAAPLPPTPSHQGVTWQVVEKFVLMNNWGLIKTRLLKSPFEKGGFRGISSAYKSPLTPLFQRGG